VMTCMLNVGALPYIPFHVRGDPTPIALFAG
jgi:hypothetical protein